MVAPCFEKDDITAAVNCLVKESTERWTREQGMVDDTTVIIAFLDVSNE